MPVKIEAKSKTRISHEFQITNQAKILNFRTYPKNKSIHHNFPLASLLLIILLKLHRHKINIYSIILEKTIYHKIALKLSMDWQKSHESLLNKLKLK